VKFTDIRPQYAKVEYRSIQFPCYTQLRGWGNQRCLCVCLFVCFFRTISQETTHTARITKRDKNMVHHDSWKSIYFGVKRSNIKATKHKNIAGMGHSTLVSAGFFFSCLRHYCL